MDRGRGKSKPTLEDSASGFIPQRMASKTREKVVLVAPERGLSTSRDTDSGPEASSAIGRKEPQQRTPKIIRRDRKSDKALGKSPTLAQERAAFEKKRRAKAGARPTRKVHAFANCGVKERGEALMGASNQVRKDLPPEEKVLVKLDDGRKFRVDPDRVSQFKRVMNAYSRDHRASTCNSGVGTHVLPEKNKHSNVIVSSEVSVRERLSRSSADIRDLQINAAMSRARRGAEYTPVVEDTDGRLAILGLDFGTAFTKAVVRWAGRHYAVDWSGAVDGEDHHLLATVFSEASNRRCVLGVSRAAKCCVHEGIKLKLLLSDVEKTREDVANAVIFIALVFRYADRWLRQTSRGIETGVRWRLHVGLPTKSWDSDATTETFKTVAQAARVLACMPRPVTRTAALVALQMIDQVDRPAVDVFPEFACQLYSYLRSPERGEDLHALVDIGAGTLDVAYFNVFMKEGEALLPIFASEVDRLGAHYLIAALSGRESRLAWADGESSLSDEDVGRKIDCAPSDVGSRRSLYLSSVAEVFNLATRAAKSTYPTSPAFQRAENVRLFLCGGGSRIPSLQKRFERIAKEAANILGIRFQVSKLVRPRDIVGKLESGFDRLSVAYGLSQNAANIGSVMRSATLDPVMPRGRADTKHRDDDR